MTPLQYTVNKALKSLGRTTRREIRRYAQQRKQTKKTARRGVYGE